MGSTLFYGLLALFIALYSKHWSSRVLAVLGALLIILLIALSRVYLIGPVAGSAVLMTLATRRELARNAAAKADA